MAKDPALGYDPSDADSILAYARRLKGVRLGDVVNLLGRSELPTRRKAAASKSETGAIIEAWFGIDANPSPEPDFEEARIELKTVPLVKRGRQFTVKERTSLSMIDYMALPKEEWKTASVRKKLDRILFVFVEVDIDERMRSKVLDAVLWSPEDEDFAMFARDWRRIQERVANGKAHLLSESQSVILAPARKGPGGTKYQKLQPAGGPPAPPRAFALKPPFVQQIFEEQVQGAAYESVVERLGLAPDAAFEDALLSRIDPFVGSTIDEIETALDLEPKGGKNRAAAIIKKALCFHDPDSGIKEFAKAGISIKTLNVEAGSCRLFEAVSFPAMKLREFATEEWEESTFLAQVSRILFVPTLSTARKLPQGQRVLAKPFFWSPDDETLEGVYREWRMYQEAVKAGKADYREVPTKKGTTRRVNDLPNESETKYIHMRPHAATSRDTDRDPQGNEVTKQCLWLNKQMVRGLMEKQSKI